jgi:hypothetical protein
MVFKQQLHRIIDSCRLRRISPRDMRTAYCEPCADKVLSGLFERFAATGTAIGGPQEVAAVKSASV